MGSVDEEIFEITDFTCVTDWERFVGDLESKIRDWQLHNESPSSANRDLTIIGKKKDDDTISKDEYRATKLDRHIDTLKYGDQTEFKISYIFPKSDTPELSPPATTTKKKVARTLTDDNSPLSHVPSAVRDLLQQNFDFVHESVDLGHHIVRYYGLRQFIVLEPVSFASSANIISEDSFINLLMSAILAASLNTSSDVPIFLQVADQWRWLYNGVCQNHNTRTYFEMVHSRNALPKCCHLSGILDIFKEQVACSFTPPPPVKVSLRIIYELREAFDSNWPSQIDDVEKSRDNVLGISDIGRLSFGAIQDTIDKIYLSATWLNLNEDMLVENDVYSDLEPLTAPYWNATVEFTDIGVMLLAEALSTFLKLACCQKNVDDILGPNKLDSSTAARALGRLTNPSLLEISILQSRLNKHSLSPTPDAEGQAPLDDAALTRFLQYLFPDAGLERQDDGRQLKKRDENDDPKEKSGSTMRSPPPGSAVVSSEKKFTKMGDESASSVGKVEVDSGIKAALRKSKTAPTSSLTCRLALVICHLAKSMQGITAACQLWREFILELRYRWEHGIALPGFDGSNPGLADCLLHQKLQMLNCCILHKLKRQKQQAFIDARSTDSTASSRSGDEFYDCFEDTSEIDQATVSKPEGRMRPLAPDAFLLENPNEQLFIPVTQDPAPVTEDVLEQYGRMLTNMGTSDESAFARAKMQTPSLLSDMEAFKAANPNARMEDFIRWYSPRDWIEELDRETGTMAGSLSERMSTPGNLWREVWDNARPVPVARQKRLFDDTTEAEKILHWLYGMQLSEVSRLLAAPLFTCALLQLEEEAASISKFVADDWKSLTSNFVQATLRNSSEDYENLCSQMAEIERLVSRYRSLLSRLSNNAVHDDDDDATSDTTAEIQNFVLDLLVEKDVKILGASRGILGRIFSNMFSKDDRLRFQPRPESGVRFPPYYSKEYILRWSVPRPQAKSRECPQRCYVRVKANEFRAASAFTEDVVFFLPERM